jgi:hypothetical protein
MRRKECHNRIEQVRSHYETALRVANTLIRLAEDQPKSLHGYNLTIGEMRPLLDEFHDMYFTRMFAWFESDLRHYWRTTVRDTRSSTEQLLSGIAARRAIPRTLLADVHEFREFRNYLIHEEHEARSPITIDVARHRMNAFLAWLPLEW